MKLTKTILIAVLAVLVLGSSFGVSLEASEERKMTKEEAEMMKKWQAFMTPGPNHKYMEYFVGEWDSVSTYVMAPGQPPSTSKIQTKFKMLLGGRYLKSYYKGTNFGMEFEGIGTTCYNNFTKKFTSIFMDSLGTGFAITHGTLDKSGKIRTEIGDMDDPMSGQKSRFKTVTKIVDQNKYVFEMYMLLPDGKEFKSMTITSTRKK